MAKILAVSGSPIKSGNIEKAMAHILKASEEEWELIRLSSITLKPCVACLNCADNNRCVLNDDMNECLEKVLQSEALVISGFPTFLSLNSSTKIFTERMYPLKHKSMLTTGKLGVVVAGGFRDAHVVGEYLSTFFGWFKMELVGTLSIGGNAPCLSCGYGEICDYSNVTTCYGENPEISPSMFYTFEHDEIAKKEAEILGEKLGDALRKRKP